MKTELSVEIDVNGTALMPEEVNSLLQKNGLYISISVSVPGLDARGGANYVKWTHYDGKNQLDNGVIENAVTEISTDHIVTVKTRSLSPFTLEFMTNDNEPDDSSDNDSDDTDVSESQWIRAADGIRWWYRYPDGSKVGADGAPPARQRQRQLN